MTKKSFAVSIPAIVFALLFMAGTKSIMAQTPQTATSVTTTINEPVSFMATTCDTFETITFTGFQKTVYEVKDNKDGSPRKMTTTVNWEGVKGTTGSGVVYKGTYKSKESFDLDGLPSYYHLDINQRWTGKGKAPDMIYRLRHIVRIDALGNVTREKESERVECK